MKKILCIFIVFIFAGIFSDAINLKPVISSAALSSMQSIRNTEGNTNNDGLISEIMEYAEFQRFKNVLLLNFENNRESDISEIIYRLSEEYSDIFNINDTVKLYFNSILFSKNPKIDVIKFEELIKKYPEITFLFKENSKILLTYRNSEFAMNLYDFINNLEFTDDVYSNERFLNLDKYFLSFIIKRWEKNHKFVIETKDREKYRKRGSYINRLYYIYDRFFNKKNKSYREEDPFLKEFAAGELILYLWAALGNPLQLYPDDKSLTSALNHFLTAKSIDGARFTTYGGYNKTGYCYMGLKDFVNAENYLINSILKEKASFSLPSVNHMKLIYYSYENDIERIKLKIATFKKIENEVFSGEKLKTGIVAHEHLVELYNHLLDKYIEVKYEALFKGTKDSIYEKSDKFINKYVKTKLENGHGIFYLKYDCLYRLYSFYKKKEDYDKAYLFFEEYLNESLSFYNNLEKWYAIDKKDMIGANIASACFWFADFNSDIYSKIQKETISEKIIGLADDYRGIFSNSEYSIDYLENFYQDVCILLGIVINYELSEHNDQYKAEEYAAKYIDYVKDYLKKFPEGEFKENFSFSTGYYYYAVYKDYENALNFFLKAKEYGGNDFFVKEGWTFSIMMMYMLERYDECSKLCQELIDSNDFDDVQKLSGYLYLARSLSAIGEITGVTDFFKKAEQIYGMFKQYPYDSVKGVAYIFNGENLFRQKKYEEAKEEYKKGLKYEEYDQTFTVEAYIGLIKANNELGDFDESVYYAKKVLSDYSINYMNFSDELVTEGKNIFKDMINVKIEPVIEEMKEGVKKRLTASLVYKDGTPVDM
ncbi:MAG: hypothetical protein M0R46_18280, partial [Candidatus Muirbacterium halophilum]|nr:hypothetical protein [Candidatus Muirbacterium halophilum]